MRQRARRAKLIQTGIMHASVSRVRIYEKKRVDILISNGCNNREDRLFDVGFR